ncbi:hypothetical protein PIB30_023373 [Stylosanthes scabra]|uniref:Uncharacterized protein n=1 Tax=Stylosanthes scabra TaxID=79078 RepID=A0ABU6U8Z1_9FABA|nr:hypothetical protein [Stylosanthes scabra]
MDVAKLLNSASVLDRDTTCCFLLDQAMRFGLRYTAYPFEAQSNHKRQEFLFLDIYTAASHGPKFQQYSAECVLLPSSAHLWEQSQIETLCSLQMKSLA